MTRHFQGFAADLSLGAGHSLGPHQTPLEGRYSRTCCVENSGPCKGHARETLVCPPAGLLNARGLCPQTLLVSVRLEEGAATRRLRTDHQEDEREGSSNQRLWLAAFRPEGAVQSEL